MLLILPPSETKRDGGVEGTSLKPELLRFPELLEQRHAALSALHELARDQEAAAAALGLGPTQAHEVRRNRELQSSALLPAIDRYTGVLYDGLAVETFTGEQREFAAKHVVIHSALFGLLAADERIPAYRLSHNSRLPGLSLVRHWRSGVSAVLAQHEGLILDLRSEAYAKLGPAPNREGSYYVRVLTESNSGVRNALSHFNKKAKGEFTRAVIEAGLVQEDLGSLTRWARGAGIRLELGKPGEVDLIV